MKISVDKVEKYLFLLFLAACFLLVLSYLELPVIKPFKTKPIYAILINDGFKNIVQGISLSLIAAYIFHLISNFVPRLEKKSDINFVLNLLIAAVLDSYRRVRVFGHETPISHVNTDCLDKDWIIKEIERMRDSGGNILPLKFAFETAHSRYGDYKNLLSLATELSPSHALNWLVLVDKVRLMVEEYDNLISGLESIEEEYSNELSLMDSKKKEFFDENISTYRLRFMEFLECALKWIEEK